MQKIFIWYKYKKKYFNFMLNLNKSNAYAIGI